MIPLDITPVSAPTATNSNAMSSLADMLAEIGMRNKKLAEDARQFDAQNALAQQHEGNTTRYYDMQADTNRMNAEDRGEARKEKAEGKANQRLDFLRDAYRKAKSPQEKRQILDQIRSHASSLGMSFDELPAEDTATSVAEPASVQAPEGAKPGFTPFSASGKQKFKQPKVNSGFAGALGAYMNTPEATASSGEVDGGTPGVNVSPFPWDELGLPKPPANEMATPSTKKGSGRFALKDKEGNLVQMWDEGQQGSDDAATIRSMMQSRPGDSAEEKEAANLAIQRGTEALKILGPEKAALLADAEYQKSLARFKKQGVAGAGGSGGGGNVPSKIQMKLDAGAREGYDKIIDNVSRDARIPQSQDFINFTQRGLAHFEAGEKDGMGMQQLAGLKEYMLAKSGKVVTDKEMDQFLRSAGFTTAMESKLNQYFQEGRMPPEFSRQLSAVFRTGLAKAREQQLQAGKKAYEQVKRYRWGLPDEDVEQMADSARGYFTGQFQGEAPSRSKKPAPKGGGAVDGEARLNKLLGPR